MRKILIICLIGLCAGFVSAAPTPALASGHGKAAKKKEGHDKPKKTTAIESFLEFSPGIAAFYQGNRPSGMIFFEYGLDIPDAKLRSRATALMPRLRDIYSRILVQYAGNLYHRGEVPDLNYLVVRMQAATNRVLGSKNARFIVSNLMVRES